MDIVNISAYKFIDINDLDERRQILKDKCFDLRLKGTILLSLEGINLFLAGTRQAISQFTQFICADPSFSDMTFKESLSLKQPFRRMLVKIKKEIIPLGDSSIRPHEFTGRHLAATELRRWLDEGREFTLLDTRNDYEVKLGSFDKAIDLDIDHFREFPQAVSEKLNDDLKEKPLVMFCTGGIRCEKASVAMMAQGYKEVYQLDGGILKYFEECGGAHYQGECFVFDQRVGLNPQLEETHSEQCYCCREPLLPEEQLSKDYQVGKHCPYCIDKVSTQGQ